MYVKWPKGQYFPASTVRNAGYRNAALSDRVSKVSKVARKSLRGDSKNEPLAACLRQAG
jgi:hypothetical protein